MHSDVGIEFDRLPVTLREEYDPNVVTAVVKRTFPLPEGKSCEYRVTFGRLNHIDHWWYKPNHGWTRKPKES